MKLCDKVGAGGDHQAERARVLARTGLGPFRIPTSGHAAFILASVIYVVLVKSQ